MAGTCKKDESIVCPFLRVFRFELKLRSRRLPARLFNDSLVRKNRSEDQYDNVHEESDYPFYTHFFYPPSEKRKQPDFEFGVPHSIVFVLKELYTAINNKSRYLASTGIRTVLDMMIVDKIGDEGTFKDKVDKLIADGHINADEGKIMSAVIEAGNASAHRGFMPDDDVLSSMMDILERLIDKFYLVHARHRDSAAKADRIIKKVPSRPSKQEKNRKNRPKT